MRVPLLFSFLSACLILKIKAQDERPPQYYISAQCALLDSTRGQLEPEVIREKENVATDACCKELKLECRAESMGLWGRKGNWIDKREYSCVNVKQQYHFTQALTAEEESAIKEVTTPMKACCKKFKLSMFDSQKLDFQVKEACK